MNEQVEKIAEIVKTIMDNKELAKQVAKLVSPVLEEGTTLVFDTVGPNIESVIVRISLANVNIRKKVLDEYIKNGFTRDEALAFMFSDASKLDKSFDNCAKMAKDAVKSVKS